MADHDFPDDLLEAQRAYYAADAHVQEVTATLPSSQEALEGAMTDEQRDDLAKARTARLDALDVLNQHPWWGQQRDRHAAWMALQQAART